MHGTADRERIETSLLPLKKRASNYSSGAAAGDPYSSSSKKKKRRVDDGDAVGAETKDTAGALEAPVPRQRLRSVPSPAAASPEPAAEGTAAAAALSDSDDEKKRLSKGRWPASSSPHVALAPQPPVKKLMHDGIRSFIPKHQSRDDEHPRAAAANVPALSSALERRLAELGATRPWLVHSKALRKSDVDENQNRLLVSCKRRGGGGSAGCPITRCFTAGELERVNRKHAGLRVTAFDGNGSPYALVCKFLRSNNGYRFIKEWKKFLTQNGMNLGSQRGRDWKRHVVVELWAFRSRRLPFQPQLDADGKVVAETFVDEHGDEVTVDQRVSHHLDKDGALGLLLLHHEKRRRVVVKSEEEEEEEDGSSLSSPPPPVSRKKKGKQQSGKRRTSASRAPAPVALPATVAEQGGERLSEELLLCAAVGLEKLRQSISKQWQEYVDRGGQEYVDLGGHGASEG